MRQQLSHHFWIILVAATVFFTNLGATKLWDQDETLHSTCAREMFQRGDWVVPTFNQQLFPDKPPLMYWLMMAGFQMFGIGELGARFWSAVFGVGTALATYHLGKVLFKPAVGFWGGIIMASTVIFTVSARAATVDAVLVFLTTMAMLVFVSAGLAKRREPLSIADPEASEPNCENRFVPCSWWCFVPIYVCLGVAVLGKGPIGVLLPMSVLGLFLLIMNERQREPAAVDAPRHRWWAAIKRLVRPLGPRNFWKSFWQLRPLTGLVIVLAIAGPWYVLVGLRTDGVWLEKFFGDHNLMRALQPRESHSGNLLYYVIAVLIGFFPWSVLIGPALIELVARIRRKDESRDACIFLATWASFVIVFWSLVSTKLPHYVLPAYPALALMTGLFVDGWVTDPAKYSRWWMRNATLTFVLVGAVLAIALPIVASVYLPGEEILGAIGAVLIIGGAWSWYHAERREARRAIAVFAATSAAFVTVLFAFAAQRVDEHQNAHALLAAIKADSPGPPELACYRFCRESFVFYAGKAVPRFHDSRELRKYLETTDYPYVFTSDEYEAELKEAFPGEFSVVTRRPKFLKKGEVVILSRRLGRGTHTAAAPQHSSQR